jgi:poly(A) polymerase
MLTLLEKIEKEARSSGRALYVVGGAVRDRLLGRTAVADVDLAIDRDALAFGRHLAEVLAGSFIVLDEDEGVGRLVCRGQVVDLALFKNGSTTIFEDLAHRDFTMNAMALSLAAWLGQEGAPVIIDPCGGRADVHARVIRLVSGHALRDDPLRILRAFRLQAQTGFTLDPDFIRQAVAEKHLLARPAAERLNTELQLIFESERAAMVIETMAAHGILAQVCPELLQGAGVEQPASHHLDVFGHNLAALRAMDALIKQPGNFFPAALLPVVTAYLGDGSHCRRLRWAALFHDLGKPHTLARQEGRITFYQHDMVGARLFAEMAGRLRFPKEDIKKISLLIAQHMRPFHLCNILRQGPVSAKACLRLAKSVGEELPGLFLLAMADSIAGQGEAKPLEMEKEIAVLFGQVHHLMETTITPMLTGPPLLNGHDLVAAGLQPGPLFREILDALQQAQVTGEVTDRAAALRWLADHGV